jgi:hypothetical protein
MSQKPFDPSRRSTAEDLIRRINGEVQPAGGPANEVPAAAQGPWPRLVFNPPAFGQFLQSSAGFLVLAIVLLGVNLLLVWLADRQITARFQTLSSILTGFGGVTFLIMLALVFAYLGYGRAMADQGGIVLDPDRLVETQLFQYRRAFTYEQICWILLTRSGQCQIRYYVYGDDGQLDLETIRQADLIGVADSDQMAAELKRRVRILGSEGGVMMTFMNRTVGRRLLVFLGGGLTFLATWAILNQLTADVWLRTVPSMLIFLVWAGVLGWLGYQNWRERCRQSGVPV